MSQQHGEQTPLVASTVGARKYWSRWYVLCMLSIATCLQNAVWAVWGPIAQSAKLVYKWDNEDIFLITNYGNIATLLCVIPAAYVMDVKGLRTAMIVSTFLLAVANALRIITTDHVAATWLLSFCQIFNGIGGAVTLTAPPLLSETWFPSNERATATAVSVLFSSIGGASAFILGPALVSQPLKNESKLPTGEHPDLQKIRSEIMTLNYLEFGWAMVLFLMLLMYFPNKPPTPPSVTASIIRHDFKEGILKLLRNKPFWGIALSYAVPLGTFGSWNSVLDVNLDNFGISQKDAGWIGFYGSVGGTLLGLLLGRFADVFKKRMKLLMICMYSASAFCFVIFTCMCEEIIPSNRAGLFAFSIAGSVFVTSSMPLFVEIACENSYPVAEGITGAMLNMSLNVSATVFLLVSLIPGIGTSWMNWCLLGVIALTLPLLVLFKARYHRIDIDTEVESTVESRSSKPGSAEPLAYKSDLDVSYQSIAGDLEQKLYCPTDRSGKQQTVVFAYSSSVDSSIQSSTEEGNVHLPSSFT